MKTRWRTNDYGSWLMEGERNEPLASVIRYRNGHLTVRCWNSITPDEAIQLCEHINRLAVQRKDGE